MYLFQKILNSQPTETNNNLKSILKKSPKKSPNRLKFSIEACYFDAIINGDLESVKNLIFQVFIIFMYFLQLDNYKTISIRGKTSLHFAVSAKQTKIIQFFINQNLDVNAQDIRGRTPLHIAAYNNDFNNIRLLLENGSSPFIFSDYFDGFPSMVVNEYLPNAEACLNIFDGNFFLYFTFLQIIIKNLELLIMEWFIQFVIGLEKTIMIYLYLK